MDDRERFGLRLRELRKKAGHTQQKLGDLADVNYKYLGGIERADENPSLDVILRVAAGLGIHPKDLFDFDHQDSLKQLRSEAKKAVDRASPDELQRLFRVISAITQ